MSSNWISVMNTFLTGFESQTNAALKQINEELIKHGQQYNNGIRDLFRNSTRNRLDQALGVFDIERETVMNEASTNETTHQIAHVEGDGSNMKVELTSDEESSVSEHLTCSGEAEALPTYSRLNSTESTVDQRSTCSPSTSNLPLNSPITSPAPQMMNLGSIKIEPIEIQYETMNCEMIADTSHDPMKSNIIFSTNTCTATSASQTRSGQGDTKDASHPTNPLGRELLKRMHSSDTQSNESKMRKIDQNVTIRDPTNKIASRKMKFACYHCHKLQPHMPEMCETFEEVHSHWKHTHRPLSMPFQFFGIALAACYHCKKIDSFEQLVQHHKFRHPAEIMVFVDQHNHSKCALCRTELSQSAMVVHFKNEHNEQSYAGVFSPTCFTQDEVNYLSTLNSSRSEIQYFTCGYCWKHISSDISLCDHIQHDRFDNQFNLNEPCNKDKYLTEFNNRLIRIFFRTKKIFKNGLVLFNHNVLNTNLDERPAFWRFKEKFAEKVINAKFALLDECASVDKIAELRSQRAYSRHLCIVGFPELPKGLLLGVFIQLCSAIGMDISEKDVESIFQRQRTDIIVCLRKRGIKGEIQKQWKLANKTSFGKKLKVLCSKLQITHELRINIDGDFTPFFKTLLTYAKHAKSLGQIANSFMTDDGLMVQKKHKSNRCVIWSKKDLDDYIKGPEL